MEIDERYMRRALQLAALGRGNVSPNPMVGAVMVDTTGSIIGEGWHRRYGEGHAEVNAVASALANKKLGANEDERRRALRDATMYVTLEPCSHYGKTPPCAELIIRMGIPRVVVGALDPFPKVSGRGVKMLREAGVEVVTEVLKAECEQINCRFMTAHRTQRPYVMLKWAESADGMLDVKRDRKCERGEQIVISNAVTSLLMHRERAAVDAIMVGAGTAALDDPSLTVRRWSCRKQPLRIVLDEHLSAPADSRLLSDGRPTLVYNATKSATEGAVEYVAMNTCDLQACLADLYSRGVTSLMVEGGASVLQQFIEAGLWNEARIEIGAIVTGRNGVKAPVISGTVTRIERIGHNIVRHLQNPDA